MKKNVMGFIISAVMMITAIFFAMPESIEISAVSADYPAQLMNIAVYDNSKTLTVNDVKDSTKCITSAYSGTLNEQWRFDYTNTDSKGTFFRIINAASGRPLTANGSDAVIYGNENAKTQYWYVNAVSKDSHGNGLHYSILNYADTTLALTVSDSGVGVSAYNGSDSQKWLLNPAGLQGFAGYCFNNNEGNIKAADTGGLFGETVEAATFDELKKYAESDTPYTIVVTKDISVSALKTDSSGHYYCPDGRIYVHSNKTIIGSYAANTLYNVQFCTSSGKGVGDNVIIRNFEMQHDEKSNGNDSIVVYFGSGQNLWVDHVTFTGHYAVNTQGEALPDWDKFLACCYDADYCTVSDCSFGLHEYGLILGYPADDADSYKNYNNFPRMSLISNKFKDTLTRGPGLMRYGYFHSLNNYVYNFSMAYTVHTASKIYAESCYYDGASTKGNVICDWNEVTYPGSYAEDGSEFTNCKRTVIEGQAQNCTWRPKTNYSYTAKSADDAKSYCSNYSGVQSDKSKVNYTSYKNVGVPSAGFIVAPDEGSSLGENVTPTAMNIDRYYMIKNVNSGMYLTVDGINVQQSASADIAAENTWRLVLADENLYYIQSMTDDKTKVLDVTGGKTENGNNIAIYNYKGNINQHFIFTKNDDGSYKIRTKVSDGKSCIEVVNADKTDGANVQQYESNGVSCQDWILEEVEYSGEKMDTSVNYMFKNANSGLYMEVKDGLDADGQNIQQWGADGKGENNSWTLKPMNADSDLYYIVSNLGENRYLNINNDNAELKARDSKVNTQLVRFVKNPDGTYNIVTRAGYNKSVKAYTKGIEVSYASIDSGANIQQYILNGNPCQNWVIETFEITIEPPVIVKGDIDGDGKVTIIDLVMLKKYLLNCGSLTAEQLDISDMNSDGKTDIFDMVMLKNSIVMHLV